MLYLYPEFESLYWAGDASRWTYGGVVKVGTETHKFIPVGTTQMSKEHSVPWSMGIYGGFLPRGRSDMYFGGGVEFQRAYEAAKSRTVCPTVAEAVLECSTASYGAPSKEENHLVYLEARRAFKQFSASAKIVHDVRNGGTKVDVPFFLYSDAQGKISTGVRIGWTDMEAFSFGVFVGSAFDLGADSSP